MAPGLYGDFLNTPPSNQGGPCHILSEQDRSKEKATRMSKSISVVKRNGDKVPLDISKIQTQIQRVCEGIPHVSPSMVEIKAQIQFADEMETEVIDKLILKAMTDLIDSEENPDVAHVNYQFAAGRQRLSMLRKQVYGEYTPPPLYDIVKKNITAGMYTAELLQWYTKGEWDELERHLDHAKDEALSFAAIEQFVDKYLVQNRSTGVYFETPQIRYMIAAATAFHMEDAAVRMQYVKDYYDAASDGLFSLATPVLAGLGTKTKQFSSCVLLRTDDSWKSIFATGEMMADYASKRAGIGLEIGRMRPLGSEVRGGEVSHTGIVPFLKKWFGDLRSGSQGGLRNSSATVTMQIWHYQFDDFIVLKNNQGTEENRVRHMDYNVVLSAFFWRRFKNDENITFFDPNQVPDLYEAFYSDNELFEKLYVQYENDQTIKKKTERAEVVFKDWILKERTDTGRIYLTYIDNVMRHTPFDVSLNPIYQSNLCQEILLPTAHFQRIEDVNGRIALCTLGSSNWGAFRNPQEMRHAMYLLVRALSNILSYQDFLSVQSALSNAEFRPLGVGITNLAYWHAKKNLKYGQPEALAEVKRWIEAQTFFLIEASVKLAEERGPCGLAHTTCYGKGIFPWENRAPGVNDLTDFAPTMDWEGLRARMIAAGGTHNATLGAIAPVESSSVVIGSTNGIEMPLALISTKESKGSSLTQVVPEYTKYKNRYQLMWEQKDCVEYLKTSAVLAAYIDQSISTNTFYSPRHFEDGKVPATLIAKNLMLGHYWGIKTFYYSLMEKTGSKHSLDDDLPPLAIVIDDEDAEACPGCTL